MPKKPPKPDGWLAEWVRNNTAEMAAEKSVTRPLPAQHRKSMSLMPEDMAGLPRYLPLTVWAALLLGEHAPHYNTLLRWVHDGFIQPQPVKIGKKWCVRKDAAYVPD